MARDQVIVDLDGTLLDTRARHHAAYAQTLRLLGGEALPLPRFWRAKRAGVLWPRLLGPGVDAAAFMTRFIARIEAPDLLALDRLQPGAAAGLRRLADAGRSAHLVTARRDGAALARQLEALSLADALASVTATGAGPKHAPVADPDRVLRWIGDSEADIAAARALGAPVTAVTNGIRNPTQLARAEPDELAPSFGAAVRRLLGP